MLNTPLLYHRISNQLLNGKQMPVTMPPVALVDILGNKVVLWQASNFSLQYPHLIKQTGHENKGNDH